MGTGGRPGDDLRRLPDGDALPLTTTAPADDLVWYASYGSNLCAARFACYLRGGLPPGAARACRGARDGSPPALDRPLDIPYPLYFAGSSKQWGGAPCFIDTAESAATPALARAYLITWGQFEDVVAQENGRPTTLIELPRHELVEGFSRALGSGRYDNLLCVGRMEGSPVLTFTAPWAMADTKLALGAPSPAYLQMLISGLRESRALSDDALVAYLGAAPGCSVDLVVSALGRSVR